MEFQNKRRRTQGDQDNANRADAHNEPWPHLAQRANFGHSRHPRVRDQQRRRSLPIGGSMEGMLIEEVKDRFLKLWILNASQNDSDFAWPNGETYRNFRERIFAALSRISALHPNALIPVVTHTGVIAQVVAQSKVYHLLFGNSTDQRHLLRPR
jgi:histidine phosphatase superfamily protein (branch 1)